MPAKATNAVLSSRFQQVKPEVLSAVNKEIKVMEDYWERVRVLLEEDESCYASEKFFPKLPNEKPADWEKRKIIFLMGFCNPSQELITTKADFIFKKTPDRKTDNADLQAFIAKADRGGQSLNDFMKNLASPILQGYGTLIGVVDKPRSVGASKAEELAIGMPYLCMLNPCQIIDWRWAQDGHLSMFRYQQAPSTVDVDPFSIAPEGDQEYVTWTRTEYFRHNKKGEQVDYLLHNFGIVPVAIQAAFLVDVSKTLGKSSFFASSRLIIMANNHLSVANFEIVKYGSVLLMDQNDIDPNQVVRKKEAGTNLTELTSQTADGSVMAIQNMANPPAYLTKDIEVVGKANEQALFYFQRAADTEATGQEPMPLSGQQKHAGNPQSGVSKGYDFQDTDANLCTHAQHLEAWELQVLAIVSKMLNIDATYSVMYPSSFDVENFSDKIAQIAMLQEISYQSRTGMAAAQRSITSELTNDEGEQKIINDEITAAFADGIPLPNPDSKVITAKYQA